MAKLSISAFVSKWGTLFADNSSRAISEQDIRDFRQDVSDSFLNLTDQDYTGIKGLNSGISTIANLKSVISSVLSLGVVVVFRDTGNGNVLRLYELVSGTDAETSPDIIRPNDYATTTNERVWKIANVSSSGTPMVLCGSANLTGDLFPTTGGTGISGSIKIGNTFRVSVAGAPSGNFINVNAEITALVDTPGQTYSNWWVKLV